MRLASLSPSPRSKRLRRAQEANNRANEKGSDRARDRDSSWRERDSDRARDRGYDRRDHLSARDRDFERNRHGDLSRDRESERGRDREKDRGRKRDGERGRDKELALSRERSPDRRTRERHSPSRPRFPRSSSPSDLRQRRSDSPRKMNMPSSPPHRTSDRDKDKLKHRTATTAMRDEGGKYHEEELWLDGTEDSVAKMKGNDGASEAKQKEKPSFEYSGKLAAETNKVRGVTLLYNEPSEARKPTIRWRLYIFKDGEPLNEPLYIHRQSCYLFGRERRVADVPTDHPSCSKQHAVIQYRLVEKLGLDDSQSSEIRPYLMDLGSTNCTFLNGERLEPQRYYELFEKDTLKFGNSSREYVLLHEHSAG